MGALPEKELGGHVVRRATQPGLVLVADQLGEAKIADLGNTTLGQHHVVGFEIAMDDSGPVCSGQPTGDLQDQLGGLGDRRRRAVGHVMLKAAAGNEFHLEKVESVRVANGVRGDHVGVHQGRCRSPFGHEPADIVGVTTGEVGPENLQRTPSQQVAVAGQENPAHAACAQQQLDVVAIEYGSDQGLCFVRDVVFQVHGVRRRSEHHRAAAART